MNDLIKYKSDNIAILNKSVEVNSIKWGYSHPNCDALYLHCCQNVRKLVFSELLLYVIIAIIFMKGDMYGCNRN